MTDNPPDDQTVAADILQRLFDHLKKEQSHTAASLAKALGISESTWHNYRRGKRTPKDSETAKLRTLFLNLVGQHLGAEDASRLEVAWAGIDRGKQVRKTANLRHAKGKARSELLDKPAWRRELDQHLYLESTDSWPVIGALLDPLGRFRFGSPYWTGLAPYVEREIDNVLHERLRSATTSGEDEARFIVLAGKPKTGKTRTVFEALGKMLPDATLFHLAPHYNPGSLLEFAHCYQAAAKDPNKLKAGTYVILIDDLHLWLGAREEMGGERSGLDETARLLTRIRDRADGTTVTTVVVATCHDDILGRPPGQLGDILTIHDRRRIESSRINLPAELSDAELQRATGMFAEPFERFVLDPNISILRLPETLAGRPALEARITAARSSYEPQMEAATAVIAALEDARAFQEWGLPEDELRRLTETHWLEEKGNRNLDDGLWEKALNYILQTLSPGKSIWSIATQNSTGLIRLSDPLETWWGRDWRPTEVFFRHLEGPDTTSERLFRASTWVWQLSYWKDAWRIDVELLLRASELMIRAAESGPYWMAQELFFYAVTVDGDGNGYLSKKSESLIQAAADSGNPDAIVHCALFGIPCIEFKPEPLMPRGYIDRTGEKKIWKYRAKVHRWRNHCLGVAFKYAEHADASTNHRLAVRTTYDFPDESLACLRRAAENRYRESMLVLAQRLRATEPEEALNWLRLAAASDEAGNDQFGDERITAMRILARWLETTEPEEALNWLRLAAENRDPESMLKLAQKLEARNPEESVDWLRRAAQVHGYVPMELRDYMAAAMHRLADSFEEDDPEETLKWLRRLAARVLHYGDDISAHDIAQKLEALDPELAQQLWSEAEQQRGAEPF